MHKTMAKLINNIAANENKQNRNGKWEPQII